MVSIHAQMPTFSTFTDEGKITYSPRLKSFYVKLKFVS